MLSVHGWVCSGGSPEGDRKEVVPWFLWLPPRDGRPAVPFDGHSSQVVSWAIPSVSRSKAAPSIQSLLPERTPMSKPSVLPLSLLASLPIFFFLRKLLIEFFLNYWILVPTYLFFLDQSGYQMLPMAQDSVVSFPKPARLVGI